MNQIRVLSGMRATGALHIGHYFGAITNFIDLQKQFDTYLFVATWHCLTTEYKKPGDVRTTSLGIVADWLACGVDPNRATIFLQDEVLEHAELHLLFSMMAPLGWLERVPTYKEQQEELREKELNTYGFLGYPLLQAADIAVYKSQKVPVGQDQLPHLELTREVIRRFNHLYDAKLPEPDALMTKNAKVPGLDGRKMSKSYGNGIGLSEPEESVKKRVMVAVTDPQRVRRTDPGNPEVCPIFGLHQLYTSEAERAEIDSSCRAAGIGCVDCKKKLLGNMLPPLAEIRAKRAELNDKPEFVRQVVGDGAAAARKVASETMREVRAAMGMTR